MMKVKDPYRSERGVFPRVFLENSSEDISCGTRRFSLRSASNEASVWAVAVSADMDLVCKNQNRQVEDIYDSSMKS